MIANGQLMKSTNTCRHGHIPLHISGHTQQFRKNHDGSEERHRIYTSPEEA